MDLSSDEQVCVGLIRKHGVDSKKLEKLIDQSVNQAGAMIAEYDRTQKMPVQLAKAFLGGVFSGSVVHTIERDQRDLQIGPLQKIVQNPGDGKGQIPSRYIDDSVLGKGNGVQSRLTAIEERRSKAEANLKKVRQVLHECAPVILEDVADSIKATGAAYTKLFDSLQQKAVMAEVARLVQDLLSTAPGGGSAKALQPKSKHYPHLSDPEDPLFMIALLKDAQFAKNLLDAFAALIVSKVFGSEAKFAPLKSVERGVVKVYEKYDCRFDKLTDVARVTIVCADECVLRDVLKELKKAVEDGAVRIYRIKFRLGADYDAAEAGGYRDVLINMAFPPKDGEEEDGLHLVELQLNLAAFVDIKSGGGHASYSVGRILQAFDTPTTTYTGMATPDVVRDMQTGLIKKATVVGIDGAETEARMVEALGSHSVQLVELKLVSIAFSGTMGNLEWLAASVEHLAPTLKVLIVKKCGVKGPIPLEVGEFSHLAELILNDNELDGPIPDSLGKCAELKTLDLQKNQLTGPIPDSLGKCTRLERLYLNKNQLTGEIPNTLGNCVQLEHLLVNDNQLSGQIPNSIGYCKALTVLDLCWNKLDGQIPNSIGNCEQLREVRLQDNQLSGQIPDSTGNCVKLEHLYLFDNQLTGQIPDSIGNCKKLADLRLSNNNLSGQIPDSIGNCVKLKQLYFDENKLEDIQAAKKSLLEKLPRCNIIV